MTPEAEKATYRRFLTDSVTVRRTVSSVNTDAVVAARIKSYSPQELSGTIMQGDQKAILLAEDLTLAGWPVPPKNGDMVIVQGRTTRIVAVDQNTRRVGSTIIAYECQVRGT